MNRSGFFFILLVLLAASCSGAAETASAGSLDADSVVKDVESTDESTETSGNAHLFGRVIDPSAANAVPASFSAAALALLQAYPDFIVDVSGNTVRFADGSTLAYDDGKVKSFDTMLDNGDIEDMFFIPYDSAPASPAYLHDAGRSRNEALFRKMYGESAEAVRRNLVKVEWFGQKMDFTAVNGAADSLAKVAAELQRHPRLHRYIRSSGTFYWRPVRGAKRLSAHSYGIAIDIAVPYSDYWLWKNRKASETDEITYANRFPRQLVGIFERYGFIWGGAWYHYDTMHFEFRPEIIGYARQLSCHVNPCPM